MLKKQYLTILFILSACYPVFGQQYFPITHSELQWKTFSSKYANFIYHDPLEEKAKTLAAIFDEIYKPICDLYNYYPNRLDIVLKDTDDYSNGAAYFYDDKIEIWATALDFPFRGDHDWLKDVISHEFTHIVQIQSAMKWSKTFPAIYFQMFGYEDVRRPDVLYGFPNTLISVPVMSITVPAWLAEGTAQNNLPGLYYDFWDSHRDMILRSRTLDSTLLTFSEMVGFNKNSLDAETVYNQGYSLSSYLVRQYGALAAEKLNQSLKKLSVQTISGAMKDAFGKSGEEIYADWVNENLTTYHSQLSPIKSELNPGKTFHDQGFINWADDYDSEKNLVIVRSNTDKDYSGQISVLLMDTLGNIQETIEDIRPNSRIRLITVKKNKYLLFSQISMPNHLLSAYSDLYLYDLKKKVTIQLTNGARLFSPVMMQDSKIMAIRNNGGGKSLVTLTMPDSIDEDLPFINYDTYSVENTISGIEFYSLDYNHSTRQILLDASVKHGRQIYLLDINSHKMVRQSDENYDSRDPRWIGNTQYLCASDRSGIFNIYETRINSSETIQRTQVSGGAFSALKISDGKFIASSFGGFGYKLKTFDSAKSYYLIPNKIYPYENHLTSSKFPFSDLNDKFIPSLDVGTKPFVRNRYPGFSVYPVYRLDAYTKQNGSYFDNISQSDYKSFSNNILRDSKFGFYAFSTDPLDKIQFSASVLAAPFTKSNKWFDFDKDIYVDLNFADNIFTNIVPVRWGIDSYYLTRMTYNSFEFSGGEDTARTNVIYQLFQFDFYSLIQLGLHQQLKLNYAYTILSAGTEPFYWRPIEQTISGGNDDYYKSNQISLNYNLTMLKRSKESEIAPIGREGSLTISHESGELLENYDIDESAGVLIRRYSKHDLWRISLGYKEHLKLPFEKQTLSLWLRRSSVITKSTETFFYNYVGGFLGMRGYPFYAIGGFENAHVQINWKFPIIQNIDYSIGNLYFNRLHMSVYSDFGNAWLGSFPGMSSMKKDIGAELRFETTAFYLLPLRFFVSSTYGLDEVVVRLPKEFVTSGGPSEVKFGKEWLFHVGLLFNFDLGLEH